MLALVVAFNSGLRDLRLGREVLSCLWEGVNIEVP